MRCFPPPRAVAAIRIAIGTGVVALLIWTYVTGIPGRDRSSAPSARAGINREPTRIDA